MKLIYKKCSIILVGNNKTYIFATYYSRNFNAKIISINDICNNCIANYTINYEQIINIAKVSSSHSA